MSTNTKLPVTVSLASLSLILLSDGASYMPESEIRPDVVSRYPDLVIENNIPAIREAAISSLHQLFTLTIALELFSFESIVTEALEIWNKPNVNTISPSDSN